MLVTRVGITSLAMLVGGTAVAHAEDDSVAPVAARDPANADSFTPALTRAALIGHAIVTSTMSYSEPLAKDQTTVDLNGEIAIYGPLRLVLRVDSIFGEKARPGIGGAVQFLKERDQGVDASLYVAFKTEGFTETEGEIESVVSFAKQMGDVHGTLNLAYGQDPDNVERDGELALGLHIEPLRGLFTGLVGRYRDALGSNGDKGTGIIRDALGGVAATYAIGRFGVTGSAGFAGIKTVATATAPAKPMQFGPQAALAVGAVF
jgi:hypothetical protein